MRYLQKNVLVLTDKLCISTEISVALMLWCFPHKTLKSCLLWLKAKLVSIAKFTFKHFSLQILKIEINYLPVIQKCLSWKIQEKYFWDWAHSLKPINEIEILWLSSLKFKLMFARSATTLLLQLPIILLIWL